jgi:SAM-dependent methyltransferase
MIKIELDDSPTEKWSRETYDYIYGSESAIRLRDGFYRWIFRLLDADPRKRLLDIACGQGRLVKQAIKAGVQGHGIDISSMAIQTAHRVAPGGTFMVADGEHIPYPDNSFDYVTNIGSLEHYQSPEKGMREIARVLRPGGTACIHIPNLFGLFWNVLWVWRTGDICIDEQPIQRYGTRGTWQRMLEANGLHVLDVKKHIRVLPNSAYDLAWYAKHPKSLIYLILTPFVPVNLGNSLVFLCTKS